MGRRHRAVVVIFHLANLRSQCPINRRSFISRYLIALQIFTAIESTNVHTSPWNDTKTLVQWSPNMHREHLPSDPQTIGSRTNSLQLVSVHLR